MNKKYLRDVDVVPRTGFVYQDKDTKQIVSGGSFRGLVKNIIKHRKLNGLETDATIEDSIHEYLCNNNPEDFCAEGHRGLGDVVHFVASPFAKAIDAAFGTNVHGCWSCAGRRAALNAAVQFKH